jgi:hypothetical protein
MQARRLAGIDLDISSAHNVQVLASDGTIVCRRKRSRSWRVSARSSSPPLRATGPAWLPTAVFSSSRGHTVYRVSVDPARLHRLVLPDAPRVAPDRRGARCDRLTQAAATHTRRIKDLVRQLPPAGPACPTDRQGSTASGASAGLPSGSRLPRPH